jgi:hypothetical protein
MDEQWREARMKRVLLGMLTPSSNTALEPLTSAMLAGRHLNRSVNFSFSEVEP